MQDNNQSAQRSPTFPSFAIMPILVGAAGLAFAIYTIYANNVELSERTVVVGEVVSNPSSPLVEYEFDGTTYTHQSKGSSKPPSYAIGDQVDIYIDPKKPDDSMMDSFVELWLAPTIAGVLGGVFIAIAVVAISARRKKAYDQHINT